MMHVKLIVLEGKHKDREIPLPETIFLIGRDKQCHLRPHCQSVSKLHCAIAAWAGKVRVRDLKSRNGTLLNGQPINGEVVVTDGDQLQIGTLLFAFRIKNVEGVPLMTPPIREGDVQWLLDSPSDSAVLAPASETSLLPTPNPTVEDVEDEPDESKTPPPKKRGSRAVSAGQHLRDYFAKRNREAEAAEAARAAQAAEEENPEDN
jgi:pSer/pThr/pTyr-binding forkhead associated (FHA) protein